MKREDSEEQKPVIEGHLRKVLASRAFAPSPRSREFLRFVVDQSLASDCPVLTEHRIAAEVFGKRSNFNPSEDSAVRVKASEVRKRLMTYYASEGTADPLRIELPPGSYNAIFQAVPAATPPEASRFPRWRLAVFVAFCCLMTAVLVTRISRPSIEDRFWGPLLRGPAPVLLCVPFRTGVQTTSSTEMTITDGSAPPPLPGPRLPLIGMGDSLGLSRLTELCGRRGAPYQVKISNEITFSDLRQQPAVILGWRWSREISSEMGFTAVKGRVFDRANPARVWTSVGLVAGEGPGEDYAVIGRLRRWNGGQTVVIGAGTTTFGTQAAAEFLTTPERLREFVSQAADGWEDRNIEGVIHTSVIGRTPGRPKLVAFRSW